MNVRPCRLLGAMLIIAVAVFLPLREARGDSMAIIRDVISSVLGQMYVDDRGRPLSETSGDTSYAWHYDDQEHYRLATRITRYKGKITHKEYLRETLRGGKIRRWRFTAVDITPNGNKTVVKEVRSYYGKKQWHGSLRCRVNADGIRNLLADRGEAIGADPKSPGDHCGLDDPEKVPDEVLDKYALVRLTWAIVDGKPRQALCLFNPKYEPNAQSVSMAYVRNPSYPAKPTKWQKFAVWKWCTRIQATDANGKWTAGEKRNCRFESHFEWVIFRVDCDMDYTAQPGPMIKSHSIRHTIVLENRDKIKKGPDQCKDYKIEVTNVTDGPQALRGQWVTKVIPPTGTPTSKEKSSDDSKQDTQK